MLFDHAIVSDSSSVAAREASPDDAAFRLLRHVLKVWAREQGVSDTDVGGFVDGVLSHAAEAARDGRFGRGDA